MKVAAGLDDDGLVSVRHTVTMSAQWVLVGVLSGSAAERAIWVGTRSGVARVLSNTSGGQR